MIVADLDARLMSFHGKEKVYGSIP